MGSPAWESKTKRFSIAMPKALYDEFTARHGELRHFIRAAIRAAVKSEDFFFNVMGGDYDAHERGRGADL